MIRTKKIAVIVLAVLTIPIVAIYGYFSFCSNPMWAYFTNEPLVGLNLYDKQSGKPVQAPVIMSIEPKLNLIASPGTEADGAYIYQLPFPIPAIIVAGAPGYETTRFITVLRRGQVATFYIRKK